MPRRVLRADTWRSLEPIAVGLALIMLLPSLIGIGLIGCETRDRIDDQNALLERQQHVLGELKETNERQDALRTELLAGLRATDHRQCREIQKLKEGFRADARRNYNMLERNAELLGIEVTPAIRQAALESLNRTLEKYAARPGGCADLQP